MKQNYLKEVFAVLLLLLCTASNATADWKDFRSILELQNMVEPQKCGDNVYWSFDEATGTLTIEGIGAMYNYSSGGAPWGDIIEQITSLDINSGVTTIGDYAFNWCNGLTSIVIPKDITSIGFAAFGNCSRIESITVDADNSYYDSRENCNAIIETATNTLIRGCKNSFIPNNVTSIGDYAFQACNDLTSFVIPEGVTSIGDYAFSECFNLTSIVIPSSVSSIGSYVFYHCYPLTSIEIPEGVTTIGDYAFLLCQALTSIEIPSSVTSIGDYAFNWCNGLTSIVIPEGVTSIGNYAFYGCDGITSIEIPSSVTSIGNWAFCCCSGLTSIVSHIAAEDLFDLNLFAFDFGVMDRTCTLYVPAGAKETYAAKEGWKYFEVYGNIVELTNEITINDGEAYTATEAQEFGKIIYNRTFNNTNWQAWYVPFAVDYNVLKEDFDVAEINDIHMYDTDDDGTLDSSTLEIISVKGGTLQANYPYFIRAKESGKKSIAVENTTLEAAQSNYIDCSSVKFKYYFIGTTTGVSGSEMYNNKYYAMSGGSMKYAQNESVSLKPFRWYMKIEARTGGALPKEVRIRHIDDITNVEEIEAVAEDNIYYDLSGRRVENPTKGIYILNGKKVFVK